MRKYILLLMASTTLGLTSCSTFNVKSDYAQTANFSDYKTYQLRVDDLKLNDIDKDRVLNEISKQLQIKDLRSSANPDLIVNITAKHKKIKTVNRTSPVGVNVFGGYYGWGFGVHRTFGQRNYSENEGSLIIDLIDAKTHKLVWQGTGSGISVDSPRAKRNEIPKMIGEIMENYPPKK